MAFQTIGGNRNYPKYSECEAGEMLVDGTYVKSFDGKFGIQYEYMQEDGGIVVLNSAGALNNAMQYVNPGARIQVTYMGQKDITKGKFAGKQFHDFQVAVDKEASQPAEETTTEDDIVL